MSMQIKYVPIDPYDFPEFFKYLQPPFHNLHVKITEEQSKGPFPIESFVKKGRQIGCILLVENEKKFFPGNKLWSRAGRSFIIYTSRTYAVVAPFFLKHSIYFLKNISKTLLRVQRAGHIRGPHRSQLFCGASFGK